MGYFLCVLLGYLLGCSNLAYYISRLKKTDLRAAGSGNLGASNATVLFGWRAGILVAIHDILKSTISVLLAGWLFPDLAYAGAAAGVACVFGHIFPFYLKFRGGKGTAAFFGMTLALSWKLALIAAVVMILATLITDYIVIGTFGMITLVPGYMAFTSADFILTAIVLAGTAVIFFRHRENILRMARHEEIGLRSTAKGEHRVK